MIVDVRMKNNSGIGVYIRNVLMHLDKKEVFSTPVFGMENRLNIVNCNLNSYIYSIKEQIEYPFKIPRCEIFWSPHYNIPVLPIRGRKRVVTIHDIYHLAFSETLTHFQKLYSKVMINAAVRFSHKVITVSKFSKMEIIKHTGCEPEKIEVIHNGVKQSPYFRDVNIGKAKYGLPNGPYILYVGNVKPHKNLLALLKAFHTLTCQDFDNYSLVIVGKKDGMITNDSEVFNWLSINPVIDCKVTFTGIVEDQDLDTIYHAASLFVFPSFYEGFGLPPLEAMLNGCPVICANTSSLPEVCGDAVLYFNPYNVSELSDKMKEVLTNETLKLSLVTKGYEQVKLFSWASSAENHLRLFTQLYLEK